MRISIIVASTLLVVSSSLGCNDNKPASDNNNREPAKAAPTPSAPPAATPPPAPAPTPSASAAPAAGPKVELEISSVANLMQYDKPKLTVPTGATVHLTLTNKATLDVLPHNWVLVKPGMEAKVAAEGLAKAQTTGYVVPGDNVLAFTPLAPPGKTAEVTFTAPAPGAYPYICTYPGHYIMMKGVLTVTP